MKEGAKGLAPLIRDTFSVDSPASALGFGWLGASLLLSGSPIAATSLSLLDANVLSPIETFAMIAGSRLGASFVVLLIGFIYMLRGKQRDISLSVGLLSLLVTQTMYPFVIMIGSFLMDMPLLNHTSITSNNSGDSIIDLIFNPVIHAIQSYIPDAILFPGGVALVLISLRLFDNAIPEPNLQDSNLGKINHLLYRPIITFLLGMVITSLTMSVSVSLSLLVPLSIRGFVRRENVIPYIMGANITTFIDTLFAAALLTNQAAVSIVLVQMVSVSLVALALMAIGFQRYERFVHSLVVFIGANKIRLAIYIALIFILPILLIWLG